MITAVSMMRDEADLAAKVVHHLFAEGVDRVVVADNLSTDGTGDLARAAGATIINDPDPGYYQAEKMTRLAERAIDEGATWVLPFDADEVWYSPLGLIGDVLPKIRADVIEAHGWDHIAQRIDPSNAHPFLAIRHRRSHTQPYPKIAFRATPLVRVHQGNHGVDHPAIAGRVTGPLEYRHFQYRSLEQMTRKVRQGAAAYDATSLPCTEGAHWRTLAMMSDVALAMEWRRLLDEPDLILDPAPVR